jgi:hypothetical protein
MKFGTLKIKMLTTLTESFSQEKKTGIKSIVMDMKSNSDFREMYLLYEDIENKYFDDKETARLYIDELSSRLKSKNIYDIKTSFGKYLCDLSEQFKDIEIVENHVYNLLDILCETDTLLNIDKKIISKKELVEFLIKPKETQKPIIETFTQNETLLHAVLTNNFNVIYNHTLNEGQKKELKEILSLSKEETETKINFLKEAILSQVSVLLEDEKVGSELTDKLNKVKDEVNSMLISKYNYYRLTQLKAGL